MARKMKEDTEITGASTTAGGDPVNPPPAGTGQPPNSANTPPGKEPMLQIYVTGPVIRHSPQWDLAPWVQEIYDHIKGHPNGGGAVKLPHVEADLDEKQPNEFFHAIRQRMGNAGAVIAVFTPGDVSVAIETTVASVSGRKIILIAEDPESVPRLLRGLPGVRKTVSPMEFRERFTELADMLRGEPLRSQG
jgi:hypothetical protein